MSEPTGSFPARSPAGRPGGAVFGLVVGLLAGVLISALLIPERGEVEVSQVGGQSGGLRAGASDLATAGDGTGSTESAAGTSGTGDGTSVTDATRVGGASGAPSTGGAGPAAGGTGGTTTTQASGGDPAAQGTGANFPRIDEVGVTDDTIRLGIAILDVEALGNLPQYDQGEPELAYEAVVEGWKRDGVLPVHGRNVELVFRRYSVLSEEDQRASCKYLLEDQKAFMVIATVFYRVGGECVAREHETPILTSDSANEAALSRGHPYFFSLAMSDDRVMRNLPHFAKDKGQLTGPVGVYYNDSNPVEVELVNLFIDEITRLGHEPAAVATTNTDDSSQNDLLAVRRFQQEGVEVAFVFTAREGFMTVAESQGYRPRYVDSDHNYGTTDASTTNFPPEQYEGTLAITGRRGGEHQAGLPHTPEQEKCLDDYEAHTGERPEDDSFKFQIVMHSCDASNSVLLALQRAGGNLNHESFVAAMETFDSVRLARSGHATFGPTKHHGTDYYRTVTWTSACTCWKAVDTEFQPLYVP